MEEAIQKIPVPKHRHTWTWILLLALLSLGAFTWWQYKADGQRIASLEKQVKDLHKEKKEIAAAAAASEEPPSAWALAVNKVPLCGEWVTSKGYGVPAISIIETLGLKDLINEGYAFIDLCADVGDNSLVFIGAKAGDMELFGIADITTGHLTIKRSAQKLGLVGEMAPNFCRIDGVVLNKVSGDDHILIYCGPANGGLTAWYSYDLKNDKLTLAQEYTGTEGSEYLVREGAVLEQFHIRRGP